MGARDFGVPFEKIKSPVIQIPYNLKDGEYISYFPKSSRLFQVRKFAILHFPQIEIKMSYQIVYRVSRIVHFPFHRIMKNYPLQKFNLKLWKSQPLQFQVLKTKFYRQSKQIAE